MTSGSSVRPIDKTPRALKKQGASEMQRPYLIRAIMPSAVTLLALGVLIAAPAVLHAQYGGRRGGSNLPATPPATAPPVQPAPTPAPAPPPAPAPATTPARRADVTYTNGLLSVTANNSSLNQILREISRQTGMKITGGVNDERVFGTYGPAVPAKILTTLLDGTGSNMILVSDTGSKAAPMELVLTPRHGGPTPPNPNAPGFNDGAEPEYRAPQTISNRPLPPQPSVPVGDPNSAVSTPGPPVAPSPLANSAPSATPADATTPATQDQSPNGVKTPQQIYDQLLKLRQQSQQPPQNP